MEVRMTFEEYLSLPYCICLSLGTGLISPICDVVFCGPMTVLKKHVSAGKFQEITRRLPVFNWLFGFFYNHQLLFERFLHLRREFFWLVLFCRIIQTISSFPGGDWKAATSFKHECYITKWFNSLDFWRIKEAISDHFHLGKSKESGHIIKQFVSVKYINNIGNIWFEPVQTFVQEYIFLNFCCSLIGFLLIRTADPWKYC